MKSGVTLVSTILNDREGAEDMLGDLLAQTRFPDEFVVLDGGSRDGTFEYLRERAGDLPFRLVVLQEKGANVSRGRNLAIENASHDIILTTDFGCRLDPRWVAELVAPFERDSSVEIVTGTWKIAAKDIQTPVQWAEWALSNGSMELIATETCLASTRSLAYKRQVWREFGKYPEDLSLAGDDAIFSRWMVEAKRKIAAAPEAICYWHRFDTLKPYLKEARRNFRGCGEAIFFLDYGVKVGLSVFLEVSSLVAIPAAAAAVALGWPIWVLVGAILVAGFFWMRRGIRWLKAFRYLKKAGKTAHAPWVVIFEVGTRLYGVLGYWQGYAYGFRHCQACRRQIADLNISRW